ncbi:hypothetical protein HPB48_024787 [Haemaphysalis longicornis]|uniref:Uncharacterized protein n=1 Tax=Haemaphysalis longicornis TaxID=44386 RepID=A0A9J6H857_HAELO|nr:hypothetical protein HPB48_024787 [Haemaphysalis longicornis]
MEDGTVTKAGWRALTRERALLYAGDRRGVHTEGRRIRETLLRRIRHVGRLSTHFLALPETDEQRAYRGTLLARVAASYTPVARCPLLGSGSMYFASPADSRERKGPQSVAEMPCPCLSSRH